LNWAKINDQFLQRKEVYTGKQFAQLVAGPTSVHDFGSIVYSSTAISPNGSFVSKARDLDFIYHIGGFDAVQLQTQIVDFLELFFRFGTQPVKPAHVQRDTEDQSSPLSLFEMSQVLQSIRLIHSSSSPIFFSSCCDDLMMKWSLLAQSNKMTKSNLLSLAQNMTTVNLKPSDSTVESTWFKGMVQQYQEKYIAYLEHLGMEKAPYDFSEHDMGMFGGGLVISDNEMIHAPSLFLRKFFPNKAILVQCGFYSFFATVNVLTFDYHSPAGEFVRTDDFDNESSKMIQFSHIVSFSYDFHLRFIQDILHNQDHIDLPIDLSHVLNVFTILNPRKARFARNRIASGTMEWKEEKVELFRYIMKHPEIYGFKPFFHNGTVKGFGMTADSLNPRSNEISEFLYTLVICEGEQDVDPCFRLKYFVIIIDKNHTFPHRELENGIDVANQVDHDPMIEYIASGYYLRDIVAHFEQRIQNLVQKVFQSNQGFKGFWKRQSVVSIERSIRTNDL
jgi:hypothetical protein